MKKIIFLNLFFLFALFFSCSKDTEFKISIYDNPVKSSKEDKIFFILNAHAFQKGKASWFIMPIEAKSKTIYNQTSLYSISLNDRELQLIHTFNEQIPDNSFEWKNKTLAYVKTLMPDTNLEVVNLQTVYNLIKKYPLASFGFVLNKLLPANEKHYIKQLETLSNSTTYRRAVIEQVLSTKEKKQIQVSYEKMQDSEKKLSTKNRIKKYPGLEDNFKMIRELLNQ